MQLFGDLGILSFVRISQLNWTGHFNRMDSKRKDKYLTIILREANKRITKKPMVELCTDINKCKITNRKERSKNRVH
jgi:hypothetical protein